MFRPGASKKPRQLAPDTGRLLPPVRQTGACAPGGPGAAAAGVPRRPLVDRRPVSALLHKHTRPTAVSAPAAPGAKPSDGAGDDTLYFAALYAKKSRKKHKTFLDGFVALRNDRALTLLNGTGKQLAKSSSSAPMGGLKEGNTLEVNSFEVEIDRPLLAEDFASGRIFLPASATGSTSAAPSGAPGPRPGVNSTSSVAALQGFKRPRGPGGSVPGAAARVLRPLHDPTAPAAVVIQRPFKHHSGRATVPVVIDPYLSRHMRPHQKDGVKYLYGCVEGQNKAREDLRGAVLADEMGLGKSLQSIALMWTLLKQGPVGAPVAEKAIIVCPASLVGNWVAEIKKWLGDERLEPLQILSGQAKSYNACVPMQEFVRGKVRRVLVISYEMFRSYADDLYECPCGIIICDEGHRLKSSAGNKTIDALMAIPCRRRVILTGTPVQNDLEEFFAMCNFVNPGALGTLATFRAVFSAPILASRDANASDEVARLGQSRTEELHRVTSQFVLRRTSKTLEKYLPPKTETVVFCRLTSAQERSYERQCSDACATLPALSNPGAAFSTITKLRKICCHPAMLAAADGDGDDAHGGAGPARGKSRHPSATASRKGADRASPDAAAAQVSESGKMQVAMSLCSSSVSVGDRVVLVSNFTATLDLLQAGLRERGLTHLRLDGSTPTRSRMDLVKRFNAGHTGEAVFLLSAKAGGVGLNLIGANRLICFDPDWNPATDLQTMARVWRDGQKKDVFVYRLMSTGTIEEKIYQRQLFKGELQLAVGSAEPEARDRGRAAGKSTRGAAKVATKKASNFSAAELKELFTYRSDIEYCDTLHVLERSRDALSGVANGDGATGDKGEIAATLLDEFVRYRVAIEIPAAGATDGGGGGAEGDGFVPCGSDDVLASALNEDGRTRGIVSYMYSKETGNGCSVEDLAPLDDEDWAEPVDEAAADGGESEDGGDGEDGEDGEDGDSDEGAPSPVQRRAAKRARKTPAPLAFSDDDESDGDAVAPGRRAAAAKRATVSSRPLAASRTMDKENVSPGSLLWNEAVDDLDVDDEF